MTVEEGIKAKLAFIAWRFRSASFAGMVAVMCAVRNRVKDSNWLPVLEKIERELPAAIETSDQRDPILKEVFEAVDTIYDGTRVDKWTNGGTHFVKRGDKFWWSEPVKDITSVVGDLEVWK